MAIVTPEGWQLLTEYCKVHRIRYFKAYRAVAERMLVKSFRPRGSNRLMIPIDTNPGVFLSQTDGRRAKPATPVEPKSIYQCGNPDCVYGAYCYHTKRRNYVKGRRKAATSNNPPAPMVRKAGN